ncbi:hypothetical protein DET1146 [Dehalococcoides mccartyi 195]|uniref:Uncharacterized protein n=1 Tax=Dehalococcoides mccartyi (strain ATCC BAA-2266 / KCTC 15142 / 195) TaxID=243164 RepID=Q3Z7D9_DEHM1|nr:hypothetical protein DET1146 [Dehalococcoides mccartyi 195]POZ59589.1 hypothetical protein C1O63_0132 [Dehalococcoides mccartyi]
MVFYGTSSLGRKIPRGKFFYFLPVTAFCLGSISLFAHK